MHDQKSKNRLCSFLWWCAGVVPDTLRLYPSEKAKYEGIGGAVLTTGVLAFLSGFYAIYTTLAGGPNAARPASVVHGATASITCSRPRQMTTQLPCAATTLRYQFTAVP